MNKDSERPTDDNEEDRTADDTANDRDVKTAADADAPDADEDDSDDDLTTSEDDRDDVRRAEPARQAPRDSNKRATSNTVLVGVLALMVGGAGGWFGHQAQKQVQAKAQPGSDDKAATAGSKGPCKAWGEGICAELGRDSPLCRNAQNATELLSDEACEVALQDVPATVKKIMGSREDCNKLVSKLCAELGKDTETCKMVTSRTKMFPGKQCTQMLGNYDSVLQSLKQMQQRQEQMQGQHPGMNRPSGLPPGHPATASGTSRTDSTTKAPVEPTGDSHP